MYALLELLCTPLRLVVLLLRGVALGGEPLPLSALRSRTLTLRAGRARLGSVDLALPHLELHPVLRAQLLELLLPSTPIVGVLGNEQLGCLVGIGLQLSQLLRADGLTRERGFELARALPPSPPPAWPRALPAQSAALDGAAH